MSSGLGYGLYTLSNSKSLSLITKGTGLSLGSSLPSDIQVVLYIF